LALTDFYSSWKGKLIVKWPPPEKAWWRWADRNVIPIIAILEESLLDAAMPRWDELNLSWKEVGLLPSRWKAALSQWRGVHYIFDESDGKGYVGSAYGDGNLLTRWQSYAISGHGGNRFFVSVTRSTSASVYFSASPRKWMLTMSFALNARGRNGSIHAHPMGSMKIRLIHSPAVYS
jgi:hypothetical protein